MPEITDTPLPWPDRVAMLSVNPDAANRDDVARMAAELMEAKRLMIFLRVYMERMFNETGQPERI